MRIFAATLATETNTFSQMLTTQASFRAAASFPAGAHPKAVTHCTAPLWVARQKQDEEGFTLIEGPCFWADPAGICLRDDYETLRDEILLHIRAALPLDGILLGLHGGMVAQGYPDCEGDLIGRVRALVGPRIKIGVEMDPHCHLTTQCVQQADVIVLFKEYPHIDFVERAEELLTLVLGAIRGTIRPTMSLYDCRMVERVPTSREPGRGFADRMTALEGRNGLLSVSLAHGFQLGDVPDMGSRILVVTDDNKNLGDRVARQLGEEFRALRGKFAAPFEDFDLILDRATADRRTGPWIIADPTDNAGGGSPGDSTFLLRRMIDRGITRAAFGPIWDPAAVEQCLSVAPGTDLPLTFGGWAAVTSGTPIKAKVRVIGSARAADQSFGQAKIALGDTAGIRINGIDVTLVSKREQAIGLEVFTNVGIDPTSKHIICLKSTNHFHAAFAPIARAVSYTDGGGPSPADIRRLPYKQIERPLWPLDPLPEGRLLV